MSSLPGKERMKLASKLKITALNKVSELLAMEAYRMFRD